MQGRVLQLSQSRISALVEYCLAYEFEHSFGIVTTAQRVEATDLPAMKLSRHAPTTGERPDRVHREKD